MPHFPYLILGGGMTAAAAVRGIRAYDTDSLIGLISAESAAPYKRPLLSKGLWQGKPIEKAWIKLDNRGVELLLGHTIQKLDTQEKRLTDDQGTTYTFDKLLLATGGTPRHVDWGDDQVIYFRTLDDYQHLRTLTEQGQRIAVIGGGFIGSEIAAALASNQKEVVMLFPEAGIGQRLFGPELAAFLTDYYRQHGVEILAGESVVGLERHEGKVTLKTKSGKELTVDGVVAGLGTIPNTELATTAGLAVDNGIVVDENLRTSHPDIYAAGDVANFYSPILDKRLRVEHEDNALTMGRLAGASMAGHPTAYEHLPFFYSDLFDLGYEAVGELDAQHTIVADWKEPFREGVLYYLRDGRVRGVLLWNVWGQVDAARQLMAEPGPFQPADLYGRLPA